MPETLIIADHIWKRYQRNEYRPSLRHEAVELVKRWTTGTKKERPAAGDPFWALKDVSFSVEKGEAVGVIGHNGAGKSTLFRCLCGVTEPTQGSVTIHGRFAPLIALGAGFNNELSGRQNIFLNAAIQGLTRKRTLELLPQILEFSELGEFIDMPVKRYSSGMTARLGFSVAIFTLPDIVFFDEVLAVGDGAFQQKCKTRIRGFKAEGRTMMFVSHSSAEVRRLCDRVLWLHHGELRMDGESDEVIDAYEAEFGIPNSRRQKEALEEAEDPQVERQPAAVEAAAAPQISPQP